jgi:hypothetical protein
MNGIEKITAPTSRMYRPRGRRRKAEAASRCESKRAYYDKKAQIPIGYWSEPA